MAAKNKAYWQKRALQREQESSERGIALVEEMFRQYQRAAKEIRKSVDIFILRYGQKHGMTYNEAAQVLNRKEMQEWKRTLGEYVAEINAQTDNVTKKRMRARLDALSANSSITRLHVLLAEVDGTLNRLYAEGTELLKKEFGDGFQEGYYKKIYDIQCRAGYISDFSRIDADTVEEILSYPWSGANFSERIWDNKDILTRKLRDTLVDGFTRGVSPTALAKSLSDDMGKGFKTAERLIRTECSWLHGEADRRAYDAAGVKRYEFMATLDKDTCKTCGDLDGKDFAIEEAQVGVNYPPLHPFDRCTTIEFDPDDAMDWFNSGKKMPDKMTYKEWAATLQIPTMNGIGGMEKDKRTFREALDKSDGDGNMVSRLILYNDATPWIYDEKANSPFAYVPAKDAIVCNPAHEYYEGYDLIYAQAHELTHRADYLEFETWKNPKFKKAIEICQKRVYDKKEEVCRIISLDGKYGDDPAFSDIISALTKGEWNAYLSWGHKPGYWKNQNNVIMEIFANITCIDVLGYSSKEEFNGLLKEIYEVYKEVLK